MVMKELSIEEKAKAYDEALEIAKKELRCCGTLDCDAAKQIYRLFPELKESEGEKIRKEIISALKFANHKGVYDKHLAWLEKQGEHANFRNKIQIGDKVTRNEDGVLVNLSQLNRVAKKDEKQGEQKPTDEEMKELLRTEYEKGRADAIAEMQQPWSEEDKNMLQSILDEYKSMPIEKRNWLRYLKDRIQPQPKQEWKQENTGDLTDFENAMMHIGNSFFGDNAGLDPNDTNAIKEQANLLLELIPKQEWSEEDKGMVTSIVEALSAYADKLQYEGFCHNSEVLYEKINWLKFLMPQNWTKEDKERYISCLQRLGTGNPEQPETINSKWFKEHVYPQSTWKPSDEQVRAIDVVRSISNRYSNDTLKALESLYNDLQKLREE